MKSILIVLAVQVFWMSYCKADTPNPYVGEWNYTYTPQGIDSKLCMKLKAGIRLDIQYETISGASNITTINSTDHTFVDSEKSRCVNGSTDDETLALNFGVLTNRTLLITFTRDPKITKDDNKNRWQLSKVEFDFTYDPIAFPDSKAIPGTSEWLVNTNQSLTGISTSKDRSFSCSRTGVIVVNDRLNITLTNMRVQAYMSGDDFSAADHCAIDQETTDLIPIIIGAALAALVIIVLVAYLIGRARANTPAYDNMK